VARCVVAALEGNATGRIELAGPELLTYEQIARLIALTAGRQRPVVHVPLNVVRLILNAMRRIVGDAVFATWEEAELLEVPMTSAAGAKGAQDLGVEPQRMADVLAA
jgi:hypothetical protein